VTSREARNTTEVIVSCSRRSHRGTRQTTRYKPTREQNFAENNIICQCYSVMKLKIARACKTPQRLEKSGRNSQNRTTLSTVKMNMDFHEPSDKFLRSMAIRLIFCNTDLTLGIFFCLKKFERLCDTSQIFIQSLL